MECLKCGHRIPDKDVKCLYCGAWIKGEGISETRREPWQFGTTPGKTDKDFLGIQVTKEKVRYGKLEDLPESLRTKVEEMLKKGESHNVEIKTLVSNFSEPLNRTSSKKKKMSFLSALKILLKKE